MPQVAVITRTKDRPHFLRRAISSVAAQTFTDYVHVIVNDGGDKEAIDVIVAGLDEKAAARIKIFHRVRPSNAPDTIFNESIDRVDSEYFAIHDDDDSWHSDFLMTTVKYLDEHKPQGAVVVRTDKIIERVEAGKIQQDKRTVWMPNLRAVSLYQQCLDNQLTPIATLYRRSAYVDVGKFDDTLPVVGDWEFGVRLLMKYDVGFIDPGFALANYHHRTTADNSFAAHDHRTYVTVVLNKYLRDELKEKRLGVGYIMNSLRYEQDMISATVRKLVPKSIAKFLRRRVR
jgi:glycosyltransferase involved in cell wall biosynthesis